MSIVDRALGDTAEQFYMHVLVAIVVGSGGLRSVCSWVVDGEVGGRRRATRGRVTVVERLG